MRLTRAIVRLSIIVAVSLGTISCGATYGDAVYAPEPPPVPRHEVRPNPPGPRHAWVPGRWVWKAEPKRYVWKPGAWQRIRHRQHRAWIPGEWVATREGYIWRPGHWR